MAYTTRVTVVKEGDGVSEITLAMSVPLDRDGFLRRACPHCNRQFKWLPSRQEDEPAPNADETADVVASYVCPYCYQEAAPDAWWTPEQGEYAQGVARADALGPQLHRLHAAIEGMNRPGGPIQVTGMMPDLPYPDALHEPDDMVRVDVPCHPEEPLKIDEAWEGEVACLVCGIRYPVDLVRALPDPEEDA